MPLLDTNKFEEIVIQTEDAIMSNMFFYHQRASNSFKKELYNIAEI